MAVTATPTNFVRAAQPEWECKKAFFMKNRTIFCLIYLSTFAVLSFGQQSNPVASRTPDAVQLLEIQRGELEFFKTIVYRYEVAWEETDLQSMTDLRTGLMKLMATAVKQLEENSNPTKSIVERLKLEKECLKKVAAAPLSEFDPAFGKQAEQNKTAFNDFIRLLEADFNDKVNAIRE